MRTGSDSCNKASVSNSLVIFRTERIRFIHRCALGVLLLWIHALVISIGGEHLSISYGVVCRVVQAEDKVVATRVTWLCALQISFLLISDDLYMSLVSQKSSDSCCLLHKFKKAIPEP